MNPELIPLPQNKEAEQAVLGAVLIDDSVLNQVLEILSPDDFYQTSHQIIYKAMKNLYRENKPIDLLTLHDHLEANEKLFEDVGGSSYLTYLTELVPVSDNVLFYAKMVKEKSRERKLCSEADDVSYKLKTGSLEVDMAGERFNKLLKEISLSTPQNKLQFISSDEFTEGDLEPMQWYVNGLVPKSSVVLITAPPGVYKTWLCLSIASCIAKGTRFLNRDTAHADVYYIDKENPKGLIASRLRKIDTAENFKFYGSWTEPEAPNLDACISTYRDLAKDNTVLVFDSLKRFHTGEENSASDMSRVMGSLRSLTGDGATAIVLHHKGKSDSSYRGSSDILAGVDLCFTLSKEGELLKLSCEEKNRFGEPFTEFLKISESAEHFRFELSRSPKDEQIEIDLLQVRDVIRTLIERDKQANQGRIVEVGKEFGLSRNKVLGILKKGNGIHWREERLHLNNEIVYILFGDEDVTITKIGEKAGVFQFTNPVPYGKQKNRETELDPWDETDF